MYLKGVTNNVTPFFIHILKKKGQNINKMTFIKKPGIIVAY